MQTLRTAMPERPRHAHSLISPARWALFPLDEPTLSAHLCSPKGAPSCYSGEMWGYEERQGETHIRLQEDFRDESPKRTQRHVGYHSSAIRRSRTCTMNGSGGP